MRGGTYLAMEGPQFSSLAESRLYRSWGCDVIGMTNMPEAKLAREAELCYASVAMVTDYDCWHPDHDRVEVAADRRGAREQRGARSRAGRRVARARRGARRSPAPPAATARSTTRLITAEGARDPELLRRLDAVAGRVLRGR